MVLVVSVLASFEYLDRQTMGDETGWAGWVAGIAGVFSLLMLLAAWLQVVRYRDDQLLERRSTEVRAAVERLHALGPGGSDFSEVWQLTFGRLDSYHQEAQQQLRSSYVIAQLMAVAGFGVVVVLGVVAAGANSGEGAAAAAAAATVGGALSAFVAKTFQDSYRAAMTQRMSYFDEPVRMVRLLAGE